MYPNIPITQIDGIIMTEKPLGLTETKMPNEDEDPEVQMKSTGDLDIFACFCLNFPCNKQKFPIKEGVPTPRSLPGSATILKF